MTNPDFNLLVALDALLTEGNVARAARRLRLSPSAMSRTLARLRATTGDPLLVRAGRGLVPSPRALELKAEIGPLVSQARRMLSPAEHLVMKNVKRTFTLRTSDGFVENFGAALLSRIAADAPGLTLHFVQKVTRDGALLRDGTVDFETGVVGGTLGPEIRTQALFRDRFVGVVRQDHPLARGKVNELSEDVPPWPPAPPTDPLSQAPPPPPPPPPLTVRVPVVVSDGSANLVVPLRSGVGIGLLLRLRDYGRGRIRARGRARPGTPGGPRAAASGRWGSGTSRRRRDAPGPRCGPRTTRRSPDTERS